MEEEKKPIRGYLIIFVEFLNSIIMALVLYIIAILSSALLYTVFTLAPFFNSYFLSLVNFSTIFNEYPMQILFIMFFTVLISRFFYLYIYWQKRQRLPAYSFPRAVLPTFYATMGTIAYMLAVLPIMALVTFVDYSFVLLLPMVFTFFIAFISVITSKKSVQNLFRT